MAFGLIATSVLSVSTSDSPFEMLETGSGDRQRIGSEAFCRDLEAYPGAGGGLEEKVDDSLASKDIEAAIGFVGRRLKKAGAIENRFNHGASEAFDIEQSCHSSDARSQSNTFSMLSIS